MNKIYLAIIALLVSISDSYAQQDPHYTQYMYNMNVINPAYAGSKENLSMGLLYRKQWVNLDGAPSTFTFSGHAPVGKNVGMGLSVISDEIGPVKENNVFADFSYTLNLGGEHKLALGLKAGAIFHKVGLFSQISPTLPVPQEVAFGEDTSETYLNLGVGAFYYTDKFYVALSIPNMMDAYHMDFNGVKYGSKTRHYFLTGGYVFDLNPNLKFKPFAMFKSAFDAPSTLDVNANFLIQEKLELGISHRIDDSFGAMINFAITPSLRIGYAYDHITSDLNYTTPSSHEFILLFDLNFPKKVSRSPRFF